MDDKMKVRPASPGMKLMHLPSRIELSDEGGHWPADQFTFRRIRDGDIFEVNEPAKELEKIQAQGTTGGFEAAPAQRKAEANESLPAKANEIPAKSK